MALQSKVSHYMKSLYLSLYSNDKVETVSTVEYVFPVKNQDGSNQSVSHFNFWIQTQINSPSEVFQGLPAFLVSHKAEKLCLSHNFFFFFFLEELCFVFTFSQQVHYDTWCVMSGFICVLAHRWSWQILTCFFLWEKCFKQSLILFLSLNCLSVFLKMSSVTQCCT